MTKELGFIQQIVERRMARSTKYYNDFNMYQPFCWLLLILNLPNVTACSKYSLKSRTAHANKLLRAAQWKQQDIKTDSFVLRSCFPEDEKQNRHLAAYIEGDGLAWRVRTMPSSDPTPVNSLALKSAIKYRSLYTDGNMAYLVCP